MLTNCDTKFLKRATSPTLYQKIVCDLQRLTVRHHGVLWILYYALTIPGFRAVLLFRLANACCTKGLIGNARFLWQLNLLLHSCDIDPQATIGVGFFFPHPVGIVIGRQVCIGDNVTIYQNVTIGLVHSRNRPTNNEYPSLGDSVVIAAGASVLGKVRIGTNAVVGANAVVLADVPDNATAVGVPARMLNK